MKQFVACLFLAGLTLGCTNKSIDSSQPVATGCRVSVIDKGPVDKHTYTYDGQGRITGMARATNGGSGPVQQYVYKFMYDDNGRLTNSSWTVNDKADGTAQYAYDDGRVVRFNIIYADGKIAVGVIRYFVNGRMSEYTIESGRPNGSGKRYFEYDANGIIVKSGFSDFNGLKFFEVVTKPVGQVKLPEQLLIKNGLPFDVLTGLPWQETIGGVGTVASTYSSNSATGQLVLAYTGTTTAIQTNPQSFLTGFTSIDQIGKTHTETYTIVNCSM